MDIIKQELFKNLDTFVNELDIAFDYIEKDKIQSIKKTITELKKESKHANNKSDTNKEDEQDKEEDKEDKEDKQDKNDKNESSLENTKLQKFVKETNEYLQNFEQDISFVLFSKQKVKSEHYLFLDNISFLGLDFSIFTSENKNTKKSIIKYLYNIYMSTTFFNVNDNINLDQEFDEQLINQQLHEFVNRIKQEAEIEVVDTKSKKKKNRRIQQNVESQQLPNLLGSMFNNKEIFNLASDVANQLSTQNINPVMMLSSIMSGKIENTPLEGIITEIQEKVETKINNGEINKEELENEAKNIMGSVNANNLNLGSLNINSILKSMNNMNFK